MPKAGHRIYYLTGAIFRWPKGLAICRRKILVMQMHPDIDHYRSSPISIQITER